MRIELTVASGDRDQDVAVEAPESAALGALLPGLAQAVGADHGSSLWLGDDLLAPTSPLAEAGLRHGSRVTLGRPSTRRHRPGVLSLHIVGGPAAGLMVPLEPRRLTIGRASDSDVVLPDSDVSRRHAVLDVAPTRITLSDLGSTNGTKVDGRTVSSGGVTLRAGQLISIGDSLLTVAGPTDTPAALQPGGDGFVAMLRPPRRPIVVPELEITLPVSAATMRPRGVQWITALLPAAAGGALAWFAHSPQFLLFALLSPVMMISTALGDRAHWRRSRRKEAASFRQRRAAAARQISEGLAVEADSRRAAAPDPAAMLRQASLPGSRVWERCRADADLLRLRVGTAELPSSLMTRSGSVLAPAGTVPAAPLCVDLQRGPLGVAGPADVAAGLVRWLAGQCAALHSPADVEIALLADAERADGWAWMRWLPHLRGRVATSADECAALVAELAATLEQRHADRRLDPADWGGPWLVLIIDRAGKLADVPGLAAVLAAGPAVGLTAICIDTEVAALPAACVAVARVHGVTGTRLLLRQADGPEIEAVIDRVSVDWAGELARGLAPLIDRGVAGSSTVPDECALLDVLGFDDADPAGVVRRWAAAGPGARSVLGSSADGPLDIDLASDGPHALIAGTTGSGKSELLQTLVAGLVVNHPPDAVNLLLIDYKGGAAFGDCVRLPHTTGLVTDLDPYLTERALRALNSELRRRERLFTEAGARDLDSYRHARIGEIVARLIIVVDEFAALAEELPEFLRGLVGVAQRGRSLGVHLVLATQRPGSAVSAEIRANTSLRVALRVTDPAESSDVIGSAVAASIERSRPGRGYLRAGTTLTCFQVAHASARSAAADTERVSVDVLGPWRRPAAAAAHADAPSDLSKLVDAVQQAAQRYEHAPAHRPWVPPLPTALPHAVLADPVCAADVAIGLVDLPDEQRCETLTFGLATGTSLLIAGAARSGRTSALVSIAVGAVEDVAPRELHVHVVDATGVLAAALRALPHCATALGPEDVALAPQLLRRLEQEATRRLAQPGEQPRLLLLVDGWDALCGALPELDAVGCADALLRLIRVGAASGVSVAVTGDRAVLAPRFAGSFAKRLLLRLADRTDYGVGGIAARDVPADLPPGRGVRAADGAVVQLAHVGAEPGRDEMHRRAAGLAGRWTAADADLGPAAIRLRPLPARVRLAELPITDGLLTIGLAGDRLDPVAFDPFAGAARLLVAGPPRSGRSTLLRLLARQAHDAGIATLVAATVRSPLSGEAERLAIPVIGPSDAELAPVPARRTLLLVDDSEVFTDVAAGERLAEWVRVSDAPLAVVVAGRADDLATSYRGLAAEVRRSQCGILLRPGPVDGELLGVRLPRRPATGPPGRGVAVGEPCWGPLFADGEPVPIQVATP